MSKQSNKGVVKGYSLDKCVAKAKQGGGGKDREKYTQDNMGARGVSESKYRTEEDPVLSFVETLPSFDEQSSFSLSPRLQPHPPAKNILKSLIAPHHDHPHDLLVPFHSALALRCCDTELAAGTVVVVAAADAVVVSAVEKFAGPSAPPPVPPQSH